MLSKTARMVRYATLSGAVAFAVAASAAQAGSSSDPGGSPGGAPRDQGQPRVSVTPSPDTPTPKPSYPGPGVDTWANKRFPPPAPDPRDLVALSYDALDELIWAEDPEPTAATLNPTCNPNLPSTCDTLDKVCGELGGGMSSNPDGSQTCTIYDED